MTTESRPGTAGGAAADEATLERLLNAVRDLGDGNFRRRFVAHGDGVTAQLATAFNDIAERNQRLVTELLRVRGAVGQEGRLTERVTTEIGPGGWATAVEVVNGLIEDVSRPTIELNRVLGAVAEGDLSQPMALQLDGRPLQGRYAELASTMNGLLTQLSRFATEVTRVAREIATEGRLGGQAEIPGVSGTWRDLTDSVNFMATNLTDQVRNIAQVTTAVAKGDLTQKINVDARGEILELKNTINTMVDQLSAFADEVTRVSLEVGSEGRLGGQAEVPGAAGTWRDLTVSVNLMATNLTDQVRNIAQVATAVAQGDLSQKINVDARGEILELKNTLNTMVDQLSSFADEVTRVSREVGSEGRLGGQAEVPGVAGTWLDLTGSVNFMANNLTDQVRNIAQVTTAVAKGDLTQKINVDARGEILELKNTINTMVDQLSAFADEVTRVAREVGTEGKLGGQAQVRGVAGTWKDLTDNVNVMADNLTGQVRSIATVATAVAGGDLGKKITIEAQGEVAALAATINGMVETLRAFADEVTRVAREVGTEGILGGQARVPNVGGTWKDLTDNVNVMADNLSGQVRGIATVTTAVAKGDLTKKIDVQARGEILELKTTINTMVDQLSGFASEVTRVAREVGTDGVLGGQAEVEGVSGTWQRLTESVNQLAGNLTAQVRAIAVVATAVTAGDLTRHITVDASGEVAELKDNINQMIANLKETTRTNREQNWLKTNLARLSGLMQGHRDLASVASLILSELTPLVSAQQGAFFLAREDEQDGTVLECIATYGLAQSQAGLRFRLGESLIGQAAVDRRTILVTAAPPQYARISSGLGSAAPVNVIVLSVLFQGEVLGVLELASVNEFSAVHQDLLEQLRQTIGVNVSTIQSNSRTEALLTESQRLAQELRARSEQLQAQQGELRRSNTELAEKAALLAQQNRDIEVKNSEIEQARQELEERAGQLTIVSQYKSEFMANMSHELRTPLNSSLILAKLLSENPEGNLSDKQIQFARTIYSAGSDLQQLINDILDLAKVEAGHLDLQMSDVALPELVDYVESLCRPLTADKGLEFAVVIEPPIPASVHTDEHRVQQVLRNLLSNATKFTGEGGVRLHIRMAGREEVEQENLRAAPGVIAFAVEDTGIGIQPDKLAIIFDAFRQADGTTSRKYGGTGLGLSISLQLTELLGGELRVQSEPGAGSTFTLYLPVGAANLATPISPAADGVPLVLAPAPAPRPIAPTDRFRGEKVLIVDDDARNVFALAAVLEQHGLEVIYAGTGVAGIRALERHEDTALVLMDVMMPELDGNATIAAIREMAAHEDLPVIAVTAKATAEDKARTLASGADDYVTKPVDTESLLDLIATHLDADAAPNRKLQPTPPD
ncbi:HAMP domain-containing protein [Amycolatopsis sp. H20-H5]|uniref:HAMP domain-containing protein n=1 Tax=Amycolatopsis sp. H20-H5 TaxID=3046309 RepID=UPI002DBD41F0|nr:HAMP domain-containing protein [Amycolatopsis sp. H20-H5]MEC3978464.1 HAMP domain-containing protein [Amycolatopsis sp. H20-H5]